MYRVIPHTTLYMQPPAPGTPVTHHLCHSEESFGGPFTIALAGAGGNGSIMLTGLARMHMALRALGHPGFVLHAFDPDYVTEANIGRQLFSPADLGQNKAEVLIHRLNCFYGTCWHAYPYLYRPYSTHGVNFLIGCVDSIKSRQSIGIDTDAAYWLDLGNRDRTGQVILGMPVQEWNEADLSRPRTFFEIYPELTKKNIKEDNAPSCSLAEALERQDLYINQAIATYALHLLWNFIRNNKTDIQGYYINLETGRNAPIPITVQPPPQPVTASKEKPSKPKSLAEIFGRTDATDAAPPTPEPEAPTKAIIITPLGPAIVETPPPTPPPVHADMDESRVAAADDVTSDEFERRRRLHRPQRTNKKKAHAKKKAPSRAKNKRHRRIQKPRRGRR